MLKAYKHCDITLHLINLECKLFNGFNLEVHYKIILSKYNSLITIN